MHVVDASEPIERLIGLKIHAECGIARKHAKAVAVAVDRQLRMTPQCLHRGKAGPVQAHHDAGAALAIDEIGMTQHGVVLVGDVEGHHHMLSAALLPAADLRHHGHDTLGDRRMFGVAAAFVVLDEIDAGFAELPHQRGGLS